MRYQEFNKIVLDWAKSGGVEFNDFASCMRALRNLHGLPRRTVAKHLGMDIERLVAIENGLISPGHLLEYEKRGIEELFDVLYNQLDSHLSIELGETSGNAENFGVV